MANIDKPFGLRLVRHSSAEPECIICNVPAGDATLIGIGDAVRPAGSGAATLGSEGRMTVDRAAAGETILGVVVGVHAESNAANIYREASTARDVIVCVDKSAVYQIQEDSDSATLALTDIGESADLVVANADTVTGRSQMELDSSSAGTTAAQLKIMALSAIPGNEIGANAIWDVKINESYLDEGAAGL